MIGGAVKRKIKNQNWRIYQTDNGNWHIFQVHHEETEKERGIDDLGILSNKIKFEFTCLSIFILFRVKQTEKPLF